MTQDKTIFIQNIYYMLSYAFRNIKIKGFDSIAVEKFDDAQNLMAAILAQGISLQLKRGLYREYVGRIDSLSNLHGKLEIGKSIQNIIKHKQKLTCEFDLLSENNQYNQILKTTLILLLKCVSIDKKYKDKLRKVLVYFSTIDTLDISLIKWQSLKFQRNNQSYRLLIGICELVIQGMLLTTDKGEYRLATFIDEQRMSKLFEKFVLEYYRQHYPDISVTSSQIPWYLDDGVSYMLPKMQSDIIVRKGNTALIIDTKYYSNITQINFNKKTVISHNLYQIFTYVKNYTYNLGLGRADVSGMLLYAKTNEEIQPNNTYYMHGNKISVKTLDLNTNFSGIKQQLDAIISLHF